MDSAAQSELTLEDLTPQVVLDDAGFAGDKDWGPRPIRYWDGSSHILRLTNP